jgi:hypothetical protein
MVEFFDRAHTQRKLRANSAADEMFALWREGGTTDSALSSGAALSTNRSPHLWPIRDTEGAAATA